MYNKVNFILYNFIYNKLIKNKSLIKLDAKFILK